MNRYSIMQMAIFAVILAGVIAVLMIALPAMGIAVPAWVVNILWVLAVVVVAVLAIKFIAGVGGDPKP